MRYIGSKIFSLTTLISITILAIAGMAGYYSIYGLMLVFSGAAMYVAAGAAAIEVGKLVLTSILFNYWKKLNWLLVTYGVIAVISLMAVTSWGVYGYLSAAYQKSQSPLEQIEERIILLESEYERKTARLKQMDDIIASISPNYISKRLEEKQQQQAERLQLSTRINQIEEQKLELSTKRLETEVHIGPIIKIAEAFGVSTDKAVHWLIILIMVVFDPLAVALTLCLNAIIREKRLKQKTNDTTPPPSTESGFQSTHIDNNVEEQIKTEKINLEQEQSVIDSRSESESQQKKQPLIVDKTDISLEPHTIELKKEDPQSLPKKQKIVQDYDDSALIQRLEQLSKEVEESRKPPQPTETQENPLRIKLINDVRDGNITES